MKQKKWASLSLGFTIVELLIVIVIIGILAALIVVAYNGIQQRASASATVHDLNQAYNAIESYKVVNGTHPTSLETTGFKQSDNAPIGMINGAGITQTIGTLSGYPDITLYAVFDVIDLSGNYDYTARLGPETIGSQLMRLDTGNSGSNALRYRIDTPAAVNMSSLQGSGARNTGRHVGWLQVRSGMTVREFAYDKAQAHNSSPLAPGAGWTFNSLQTPLATASTVPIAAIVFPKAHDEQTRTAVLSWLSNKYQ